MISRLNDIFVVSIPFFSCSCFNFISGFLFQFPFHHITFKRYNKSIERAIFFFFFFFFFGFDFHFYFLVSVSLLIKIKKKKEMSLSGLNSFSFRMQIERLCTYFFPLFLS